MQKSKVIFLTLALMLQLSGVSASLRAEVSFDGHDTRYTPVVVPNGRKLPWRLVDGVKVYHLIVEEFMHEFAPGLKAKVWGYNGLVPGPVIEAVEGDTIRVYVTNKLPEPTSVHWHGILLPSGMDGVSGLNQAPISPGATFKYEFTLRQHGTHMYHSHFDEMVQVAIGTTGMFIIHPKVPKEPRADRDFALMLGEWKIEPGTSRADPGEMSDFNILTFNGKAFPGTEALVVKRGQRVRIRVANLSPMHHHPIHLHGFQFKITETDGGQVPESAQQPETTVLTPVGSTRAVEFVADAAGDWALHCHMTHHVMNQMGHGLPNMLGVEKGDFDQRVRKLLPGYMTMGESGMGGHAEHMQHMQIPKNSIPMLGAPGPYGYIDMGGMFTILKVRDELETYADPGWYVPPAGTVAGEAAAEEMERDLGIKASKTTLKKSQPMHQHHH
jgi:FtsP/CotA-like multicopper oxidase with cupredoxin domain